MGVQRIGSVTFPTPANRNVNMMPFIMGDASTLPDGLRCYLPIVDACGLARGRHAYLSVSESVVRAGQTQRRPRRRLGGAGAWVRIVGDAIGGWWVQHGTANPLGIRPNAPLLLGSKFAVVRS